MHLGVATPVQDTLFHCELEPIPPCLAMVLVHKLHAVAGPVFGSAKSSDMLCVSLKTPEEMYIPYSLEEVEPTPYMAGLRVLVTAERCRSAIVNAFSLMRCVWVFFSYMELANFPSVCLEFRTACSVAGHCVPLAIIANLEQSHCRQVCKLLSTTKPGSMVCGGMGQVGSLPFYGNMFAYFIKRYFDANAQRS